MSKMSREFQRKTDKGGGMDLWCLAREINNCYREPFMPPNFVQARVTDYGTLWLDIGDRNGEFDEYGKMVAEGSKVNEGIQWRIDRLT